MINISPIYSFEAKLQLIRDRVASVAHHYHTGCYLVGRPGTSKTFTVRQTLETNGRSKSVQERSHDPNGFVQLH